MEKRWSGSVRLFQMVRVVIEKERRPFVEGLSGHTQHEMFTGGAHCGSFLEKYRDLRDAGCDNTQIFVIFKNYLILEDNILKYRT